MKFKRKSDLDIFLYPIIKELGYKPVAKELSLLLGGSPADWGRILIGHQKIAGEYLARLKLVRDAGLENAQIELLAAERSKKYGERTRKGRIVPHAKNVFKDMYYFNLERMTQEIMQKRAQGFEDEYDQYSCYMEIGQELDVHGLQYPREHFEEQTLRKEFINSLS